MGKLQFVHTKALEAISKYLSTFSTTSIHTPVVVLSFFSRSFSFSSFLLKKKRTYIVMKKEKCVEKWITLGARSVVTSLQERSVLQNKRELRQYFLERENNRVLPSA